MALSLGTLFVKLSADPTALARGLETAGAKIQQFGQGVKQTSENLSRLGMTMAGIGIASTALASKFDAGVKAATDDLGNSLANIAVEISRSMLPALKSINDVLTGVANSMRGMDSDTKEAIGTFTVMSGVIFVGAGALTKIISSVAALAPLLTGTLAPALKVASTYFWPIVLAIGAIILVVPLLVQAISDAVSGIKKLIEPLKAFSIILMNNIGQGMAKTTDAIKKSYYDALRDLQFIVPLPIGKMVDKIEAGDQGKKAGKDLANGIEEGVGPVESMLTSLVDGFVDYWGKGADKIKGTFSGFFDGLFGDFEKKMEITLPKLAPLPTEKEKKPKGEKAPIVMPEVLVLGKAPNIWDKLRKAADYGASLLSTKLGNISTVLMAAQQGMQAGGPWAALAAVIVEIVSSSQEFQDLIGILNETLGTVFGVLTRSLAPAFRAVGVVLKAISPVIEVLAKIIEGPFGFVIRLLATIMLSTVWLIANVWNAVTDAITYVLAGLSMQMPALQAVFVEVAKQMQASKINVADIEAGIAEVWKPIDSLKKPADDLGDAFDRLTGSMTNVPAGFRVALARFNATTPARMGAYDVPGLAANRQPLEVNVYIDGKKVAKSVQLRNARDWYVKTGGTMPYVPGWVGDL